MSTPPQWVFDLGEVLRPRWACCDCGRQAIGARGEPEVHLRARLITCGWTYARQTDNGPVIPGRVWCPHDPIRPRLLTQPRLADFDGTPVLVTHSNVALSEQVSPYLRGAPIA